MESPEQIIRESIRSRKITSTTYELARNHCHEFILASDTIRTLCILPDCNDIKFTKFWIELKFKHPLNIRELIADCIRSGRIEMIKNAFESGKHVLLSNDDLMDILIQAMNESCDRLDESIFELVCCHLSPKDYCRKQTYPQTTWYHRLFMQLYSNQNRYRLRMRSKHGYGLKDSTQVFCLTLLITNKFFVVV